MYIFCFDNISPACQGWVGTFLFSFGGGVTLSNCPRIKSRAINVVGDESDLCLRRSNRTKKVLNVSKIFDSWLHFTCENTEDR